MFRRAAEVDKRFTQAVAQRRGVLTRGEPHEARAAVTHRRDQREQWIAPTPDNGEIGLHLLAGRGFETYHRFDFGALVGRQKRLELTDAAFVSSFL
jgi:hypothetical protein